MAAAPVLSVVVAVGKAGSADLPRWVRYAEGDAVEANLEVLLVHGGLGAMPAETDHLRCLACPPGTTIPRLRAAGMRAARAPLVALTESFCRPAPGWAQALLEARAETDALAVGGPMARQGGSAADQALTLVEYGRFLRSEPAGPVHDLPLTNVSYQRTRLVEVLGEAAEELAEPSVHPCLQAAGEQLWRAPRAVMFDDQRRPLSWSLRALHHHGRLYGGGRVSGRGVGVRLFRAAVSPLVPFVQLARITSEARAVGQAGRVLRCLPHLLLLLVAAALGEAVGSLAGTGRSGERWA